MRDRLLVAASAALVSLAGNPDMHFRLINEGAAPALVATLQNGETYNLPCKNKAQYGVKVLTALVMQKQYQSLQESVLLP